MFDPRELLARSWAYLGFQRLVRGNKPRRRWIDEFLHLTPGQRVLDIGCGPADLLDLLPDGIDYHGYDFEPDYVASARQRYGDRGTFEVRAVSPEAAADAGTFDVIMAIAVLHHLTDEEADTVFAGAARMLRPGGRVLTLDGVYVNRQHPIAYLMLKLDRGKHVRTQEAYMAIANRHFRNVKATVLHDLLAVPYTHIIMEATIPLPGSGGEI